MIKHLKTLVNSVADLGVTGSAARFMILVIVAFIVLFASAAVDSYQSSKSWKYFVGLHHCRIVGLDQRRNNLPGTAWQCDDGITYWK